MIIGVDEVGRGCLAGSVVAAAVVLPGNLEITEITDSKKLSHKKREKLYKIITTQCLWSVAEVTSDVIDKINILQATMLAMKTVVEQLELNYTQVLVDGNKCPQLPKCTSVIKGDLLHPCISAASIVAKVWRDEKMQELGKKYPNYGFEQHKGYGTKQHLLAIKRYGIISEHRKSFAPIKCLIPLKNN